MYSMCAHAAADSKWELYTQMPAENVRKKEQEWCENTLILENADSEYLDFSESN